MPRPKRKEDSIRMTFVVPKTIQKQFKLAALKQEVTASSIIVDLMREYLAKYDKLKK
jgi:hypothetical protein